MTLFFEQIFAQNEITIDDLKAPSSPAFIILGINPTSIERPATPRALGFSLLNTFTSLNVIPKNFALEVTPYWLYSHPELTFEGFYDKNNLWMNTSFSLGTAPLDSPFVGTALSFGARTLLFNGSSTEELKKKVDSLSMKLIKDTYRRSIKDSINQYIGSTKEITIYSLRKQINEIILYYKNSLLNIQSDSLFQNEKQKEDFFNDYENNIIKWANEKINQSNDSAIISATEKENIKNHLDERTVLMNNDEDSKLVDEIRKLEKKRVGFLMDFAFAVSGQFLNDSLLKGEFSKLGIWITPTLSFKYWDFLATVRYIGKFQNKKIENNLLDCGLRIMFTRDIFGVSLEGLLRLENEQRGKTRYSINIEYKLLEDIYITGVFGKDFDGNRMKSKGDLITLLGINFGLGKQQSIIIP